MMTSESRPLWAPWRLSYIVKPKDNGCFLCEAMANPQADLENHVIFRGRSCFVILNRFPYTSGHAMIAPYRHVPGIVDLTPEECQETLALEVRLQKSLVKAMGPQGFNFGFNLGEAAGAGVADHLHGHLVPRWHGDNNFMPVLADVHVVPQALEETARILRAAWLELFPEMPV